MLHLNINMCDFLKMLLRVLITALLGVILFYIIQLNNHASYLSAYLQDSEKLEVQIINP